MPKHTHTHTHTQTHTYTHTQNKKNWGEGYLDFQALNYKMPKYQNSKPKKNAKTVNHQNGKTPKH